MLRGDIALKEGDDGVAGDAGQAALARDSALGVEATIRSGFPDGPIRLVAVVVGRRAVGVPTGGRAPTRPAGSIRVVGILDIGVVALLTSRDRG
jgi:hypothetical protein